MMNPWDGFTYKDVPPVSEEERGRINCILVEVEVAFSQALQAIEDGKPIAAYRLLTEQKLDVARLREKLCPR